MYWPNETIRALYLRSICWITAAFRRLECHPLTCMLLSLRCRGDSSSSALTIFNNLRGGACVLLRKQLMAQD